MKNYVFDGEEKFDDEKNEDVNFSEEDDSLDGFDDDDDVADECAECGTAVAKEKKIVKNIDGEEYTFCSKECAEEFEESLREEEEEEEG
jgi:YHS domain-containing protein